jgi:AdoMet-dependent heme synthase
VHRMDDLDFDQAPFLVIWETTRACDLACIHCRAEARPERDCEELSTVEAKGLLSTVRRFGRPLFVLTGGDPAKRADTIEVIRYGAGLGLRMGMTPSATPLLTRDFLGRAADAGLSRLAMSLDGATPEVHDRFRGVDGSFDLTWKGLRDARDLGISTQVNTTVTRRTVDDLDRMAASLADSGIALWSVFFLVPTGRGQEADVVDAETHERVFCRLAELADQMPFDIKTTAAPHYRRVLLQRQVAARRTGNRREKPDPLTAGRGFSLADGMGRARGVNDGNGFIFISHRGDVYPSGFLPISVGNIRSADLVELYRDHPLLRALRDPDRLRGKCGVCEYRTVCGGSRARAYAMTGDPLAEEPRCVHQPVRWTASTGRPASRRLPVIPRRPD